MSYHWHDFLGNVGVLLILASYLLLQMQKLSAESWLFSFANARKKTAGRSPPFPCNLSQKFCVKPTK